MIYVLVQAVDAVSIILRPLIFAGAIVFLLKPILAFLERKGVPRTLALALTYIFFIALVLVILLVLIPIVITEVNQLIKTFPAYSKTVEKAFHAYQAKYRAFRLSPQATKIVQSVLASLQASTVSTLSRIPSFTISFLSLLLDFILAPLIAYFILVDRANISKGVAKVVPEAIRPHALYLVYRLNTAIESVLTIMLAIAFFVAVLCSAGLLVLGVPYAVLLGFFAGFVQIIPYIGPVAGTIPAVVVASITKSGWYALGVAVYFTALTQVASLVLTPIMMRERVGVHPLIVIVALLLGGALFGFWGVLLAVPVAAVIHEIATFLLLTSEERDKLVAPMGVDTAKDAE